MEKGDPAPSLSRLQPAPTPVSVAELTADLQREADTRAQRPGRPYLSLNMVASVDGRATVDARSGGLSDAADRKVFHGLRSITDAVLVGAGTARTERYGRMIGDPEVRRARAQAGRAPEPLACIVSAQLQLDPQLPLLSEPDAQVVIVTGSQLSLPPVAATVQYVRAATPAGGLDLPAALRELSTRLGVRTVLGEGGPSINAQLLQAGVVDELFLSLAPVVAGGADPVRIVGPSDALGPHAVTLADVLMAGSRLFLRYRFGEAEPLT